MSGPIRVLYLVPGVNDGVSMVFAFNEIAELSRVGIEGETFLFSSSRDLRQAVIEIFSLAQMIRKHRPDIVHAEFGALTGFVTALASSVPVVITFRGSDLNPAPSVGKARNAAQKALSQLASVRAKAIICVSDELRSRLWWARDKATVIPSGVDLDLFKLIPKNEARRRLGWADYENVILFNAGRSPRVKRLDLAEAAVEVARKLVGDLRFAVLGGNIPHDEIPVYLNAADCLIVTSDYEGSPNIVKEALACNLPIASVDVGDVAQRLEGVLACAIVARDPLAIGTAAAELMKAGHRSNGRGVVRSMSIQRTTAQIVAVYESILEKKRLEKYAPG